MWTNLIGYGGYNFFSYLHAVSSAVSEGQGATCGRLLLIININLFSYYPSPFFSCSLGSLRLFGCQAEEGDEGGGGPLGAEFVWALSLGRPLNLVLNTPVRMFAYSSCWLHQSDCRFGHELRQRRYMVCNIPSNRWWNPYQHPQSQIDSVLVDPYIPTKIYDWKLWDGTQQTGNNVAHSQSMLWSLPNHWTTTWYSKRLQWITWTKMPYSASPHNYQVRWSPHSCPSR